MSQLVKLTSSVFIKTVRSVKGFWSDAFKDTEEEQKLQSLPTQGSLNAPSVCSGLQEHSDTSH